MRECTWRETGEGFIGQTLWRPGCCVDTTEDPPDEMEICVHCGGLVKHELRPRPRKKKKSSFVGDVKLLDDFSRPDHTHGDTWVMPMCEHDWRAIAGKDDWYRCSKCHVDGQFAIPCVPKMSNTTNLATRHSWSYEVTGTQRHCVRCMLTESLNNVVRPDEVVGSRVEYKMKERL